VIQLESPVRQTARYTIALENPLPTDVPVSLYPVAEGHSNELFFVYQSEVNSFMELTVLFIVLLTILFTLQSSIKA
jgi:hypothetical protein